MEGSITPQQIDIGAIISAKWGQSVPHFVVRLVERLIHQREINEILRDHGHLQGVAFMNKLVEIFRLSLGFVHEERLPQDKRALFVSNHPLGGLDGICLTHMLAGHYQSDIRYIVNDLLGNLKPLESIFLPVNKYGSQSRSSIERMNAALAGDLPVITFPAGLCSRHFDGRIQDLTWQKSFVRHAEEFHRPIVPLFFEGYNSKRFYRIERVRRSLGLKFNIGTALLPDEMFRAQGSSFRVWVGEPIPYQELPSMGKRPADIALAIRERVYRLPQESTPSSL